MADLKDYARIRVVIDPITGVKRFAQLNLAHPEWEPIPDFIVLEFNAAMYDAGTEIAVQMTTEQIKDRMPVDQLSQFDNH